MITRETLPPGSIIESRRHRIGRIHVDVCGSAAIIGRVLRKDGSIGKREVVVSIPDVRAVYLPLPLGAEHA